MRLLAAGLLRPAACWRCGTDDNALNGIKELRRRDINASLRYAPTVLAALSAEDATRPSRAEPVRGRDAVRSMLTTRSGTFVRFAVPKAKN